jgi:hypothetical protein
MYYIQQVLGVAGLYSLALIMFGKVKQNLAIVKIPGYE